MARRRKRERVSARRRAETHKSGFTNTIFEVPEELQVFRVNESGIKRLDFLCYRVGKGNPYADEGSLHFERTFWVHKGIGPDNRSYVCPRRTADKQCPICEYIAQHRDDDEIEPSTIASIAPKERQLWLLYDLEDRDAGPQIWDFSYHLFGKQLDARIKSADEDDEYEFFADLEDGLSLRVNFEEKVYGSARYYEVDSIDFKPRKTQYEESIADELPCLDDLLKLYDYDKLKSIFLQVDESEESEDEPKEETKRRKTKRKTEPEPEEDSELEDDDWDDEPKKKQTKSSKDDDDDWDDDEEEEPAKPKRRKSSRRRKDEDEDDRPSKKSRTTKSRKVEEDDDWDDDWDDEDD